MRNPLHMGRTFPLDPDLAVRIDRHLDQIVPQEQGRERRQVGTTETRQIIHHQISRSRSTMTVIAAPGATVMIGGRLV